MCVCVVERRLIVWRFRFVETFVGVGGGMVEEEEERMEEEEGAEDIYIRVGYHDDGEAAPVTFTR